MNATTDVYSVFWVNSYMKTALKS